MERSIDDRSIWETEDQVTACLAQNDVSRDQIARWRRLGLLPDVKPIPNTYHGSAVLYPLGTCRQVAEAARLFREKHRVDYVGRMLWWEGFPVEERYWKPDLIKLAHWGDRIFRLIARFMDRENDNLPTLPERISDTRHSDIIFSRVRPRLDRNELGSFLRVALDTASGSFNRFEEPERDERGKERSFDKAAMIAGLDITASDHHAILGHHLKLKEQLENTFRALAKAIQTNSLSNVATGVEESLLAARDDVRNALRIGEALHETGEWIYGRQAFGLRFVAWIAKKRPVKMMGLMILGFASLRRSSNQLLSSGEISQLADQAEGVRNVSRQLQQLWKSDPRFRDVLKPKRVREGLQDEVSLRKWRREIDAVVGIPVRR